MKILVLMFLASPVAAAPCKYTVKFRVDDQFSLDAHKTIIAATNIWNRASKGRICFDTKIVEIGVVEAANYTIDGKSTIYSGKSIWQRMAAQFIHGCHKGCLAITVGLKNRLDIFVMRWNRPLNLMVHEIGHVLGMPHSPHVGDIMYKHIERSNHITVRDIGVLECLIKAELPRRIDEETCKYNQHL